MGISSLDINNSGDGNTTSSYIEKKQDGGSNFDNAINNINARLQLDGLKLEVPKTKEQQEMEVMQFIQTRGLKKSFESGTYSKDKISVIKIENGVYSVVTEKGNVQYFVDKNGEIIFGLGAISQRPFLENGKAFEYAGFLEKKENGKYNLYKVIGLNEKGEKVLQGPIDINSKEYYQAWLDILFYADIFNKLVSLKFNDPEDKEGIAVLIDGGSFKFEDLEIFLKKGLITKEIFDYGLEEIRKKIVSQCSDQRLIKLGIGIKESDLLTYYKKGYIDKSLALECYKILPRNMLKK